MTLLMVSSYYSLTGFNLFIESKEVTVDPQQSKILDLFLDPVIGTVAIVSLIIIIAILVGLIFVVARRQLNNSANTK